VPPDALAAVLGAEIAAAPHPTADDAPRLAPGMVERHYAPRATLHVFAPAERAAAAGWLAAARQARPALRAGALLLTPWDGPVDRTVRMPADAAGYARRLYAELHALDDAGCDVVLVERPPDGPAWIGVHDRLARAAR
jgi:L-threonylcarbamoyladenylate synthase